LTPLDDAGKDPVAVAQIDLVVSATDPRTGPMARFSRVAIMMRYGISVPRAARHEPAATSRRMKVIGLLQYMWTTTPGAQR